MYKFDSSIFCESDRRRMVIASDSRCERGRHSSNFGESNNRNTDSSPSLTSAETEVAAVSTSTEI